MKKLFALAALLIVGGSMAHAQTPEKPMSFYDLKVNTLDGKPQDLSVYKGKVALVVNVASKCGFTVQYSGLEKLYADYKDKGFVVLGFPSNDFGGQEPGTPGEIQQFCTSKFQVTFPLFEKIQTKTGPGQSPVYALLDPTDGGPKWNFHKYLIGKDGAIIAGFPSNVTPDSAELKTAIDAALAK